MENSQTNYFDVEIAKINAAAAIVSQLIQLKEIKSTASAGGAFVTVYSAINTKTNLNAITGKEKS